MLNMIARMTRFPTFSFTLWTQGIGRIRMRKSSKMLNPAPEEMRAVLFRHCVVGTVGSHIDCTGRHWKATRKM